MNIILFKIINKISILLIKEKIIFPHKTKKVFMITRYIDDSDGDDNRIKKV